MGSLGTIAIDIQKNAVEHTRQNSTSDTSKLLESHFPRRDSITDQITMVPNPTNSTTEDEKKISSDLQLIKKKEFIYAELKVIQTQMRQIAKEFTKNSRCNKLTRLIAGLLRTTSAVCLLVGLEERSKDGSMSTALYIVATSSAVISAIYGQAIESLDLPEKAHSHYVTWKSLKTVHDSFILQMARNHLTSEQLDHIWMDLSSRLILIRDSTEDIMEDISQRPI